MATSASPQRPQLIHIETDRRLGHEWDEWNGKPLPNQGDFSAPPSRFFGFAAVALASACAALYALWFILAPRLDTVWSALPTALLLSITALSLLACAWVALLLASVYGPVLLLPERLAERGPFLR